MLSPIELMLSIIAPPECALCGVQGSGLCAACSSDAIQSVPPRCFMCLQLTPDFRTCQKCRRHTALRHVWVVSEYAEHIQRIVAAYKFERARYFARPIAELMAELIPAVGVDIVCPVPTATSHVRQRGFDHTRLIAREIALLRGLDYRELLRRQTQTHQTGARRITRKEQMKNSFRVANFPHAAGKNILLIDDIVTTGATLTAAAKALEQTNPRSLSALVLAQKS